VLFWTEQISRGLLLLLQSLRVLTCQLAQAWTQFSTTDRQRLELTRSFVRKDESLRFSFVVPVCRMSGLHTFRRWLEMASSSSHASSATAARTSLSPFGYMTPFSLKGYDVGWMKSNCFPAMTYQESWSVEFICGTNSCYVPRKNRLQAGG
jgi:hypothetical protein